MIFYAISQRNLAKDCNLHLQIKKYISLSPDFILIREKDLSDKEILKICEKYLPFMREKNIKLIVHKRADIAAISKADGIHLPSDSIPVGKIRQKFKNLLIIKSCHSLKEILSAEDEGADFAILSPIFDTPSKSGILKPIGLKKLKEAVKIAKIPIIALGGITTFERIKSVKDFGAKGFASIRFFNDTKSSEIKKIKKLLKGD